MGEPSITTLAGSSRIVTQGFHQPELCQVVSTHNFDLANWNVEVFPNPTSDFLTVRYSTGKGITLHATVFNLLGQVMLDNRLLAPSTGTQIDCAEWQPGVYILQLKNTGSPPMWPLCDLFVSEQSRRLRRGTYLIIRFPHPSVSW